MRDYLNLGSTPGDEDCAQVGSPDYHQRMRIESRVYIDQLRRHFGPEPEGTRFALKSFEHDFGTYHEVVVHFDDSFPGAKEFAFRVDNDMPAHWDLTSRRQLIIAGLLPENALYRSGDED